MSEEIQVIVGNWEGFVPFLLPLVSEVIKALMFGFGLLSGCLVGIQLFRGW